MGWETRRGRGRYYTRSRRQGGRTVREYIGSGAAAALAARMDAQEREERDQRKAEAAARRRQCEATAALVDGVCEAADMLARAALVLAGYRRHKRGEWRKRRNGTR